MASLAADMIPSTDEVVPPGHFTYIGTDAWWLSSGMTTGGDLLYAALEQHTIQNWVPADWHDEWMQRRSTTGERKWLVGSAADVPDPGQPVGPPVPPEQRAACGAIFGTNRCTDVGGWQAPTRPWLQSLPRDVDALYARLSADSRGHGTADNPEMLVYATDALGSGLLPADLRAALYRVIARIPGIEITDGTANLDGRQGVAFANDDGYHRNETIIDPDTGTFIGKRSVLTTDMNGIPAGTVTGYTAVRTAVVEEIGQVPAG